MEVCINHHAELASRQKMVQLQGARRGVEDGDSNHVGGEDL